MDRHELAWAAGFFDGEGWAAKRDRGVHSRINQSDNDGVPDVLLRFQRIVACGRIHGPGDVKRTELAAALGRSPVSAPKALGETELLAWAGGLYDGEGSASVSPHRSHVGHFSPEVAVTQSGATRPQALERLRDIVGCGRIYGPYTQEGATLPVFRWKAAALNDVEQALYVLAPWIGPVKRAQARHISRILIEQGRLPRGNPAWGNRKTHCVNGHEYATGRIRPYVSRGRSVPRRENHSCLVCLRDYAREQRRKEGRRPFRGRRSR